MEILNKILLHYAQQLPFVVYNKPNNDALVGLFQKNNVRYNTNNFTEVGFVFASFDGKNNIIIPEVQSDICIENISFEHQILAHESGNSVNQLQKSQHVNLVKKGVDAINSGLFKKVVLSRSEVKETNNFDLLQTFKNIVNQYPNAFSYCFFHPEIGLWLGAFSEQLIKVKDDHFSTVSLAGTQKLINSEPVIWQNKEIQEQQIVTDFISSKLKNHVFELKISEPQTIYSGSLAHIKTEIVGKFTAQTNLSDVLKILHPTPAICGFPTESAKAFIAENEGYQRGFYSGFLGELNKDFQNNDAQTDLFVNLRCMQVGAKQVIFFAGGGITNESDPEKEFQETVNKIAAMKNCLK